MQSAMRIALNAENVTLLYSTVTLLSTTATTLLLLLLLLQLLLSFSENSYIRICRFRTKYNPKIWSVVTKCSMTKSIKQ